MVNLTPTSCVYVTDVAFSLLLIPKMHKATGASHIFTSIVIGVRENNQLILGLTTGHRTLGELISLLFLLLLPLMFRVWSSLCYQQFPHP